MSESTKTGLHRAKHTRKPKVGEIVFNIDTGKMELVEPKGQISQGIDIFQGYRDKLSNSPFINTPNEKYGAVFGTSGKRETVKLFKEHRRKAYNRLPKSEAQLANQRRIREQAQAYKGKGRPPQLARSAKANLLRNNFKAAEAKARKAQQDLARAAKVKKAPVKREYAKRVYPESIASQQSRSARQYSRSCDDDSDELFM